MDLYFTEKEEMKIKMDNYVERMINYSPIKISKIDMYFDPYVNILFF